MGKLGNPSNSFDTGPEGLAAHARCALCAQLEFVNCTCGLCCCFPPQLHTLLLSSPLPHAERLMEPLLRGTKALARLV
jgi:hypothetical protein